MNARRHFLKALGGAALVPFVPSWTGARATWGPRSARAAGGPKRMIFMYAPNGVPPATWWPQSTGGDRFNLGPAQAPLAPHKDDLLVLRGLNFAARGPGGPHARGVGTALTGTRLQEGSMPSNDGRLAGWADGPSLDQHLAQRLNPKTPFASLEVGVRADQHRATNMSRLNYSAAGRAIPPISDPLTLWKQLFPEAGEPRTGEEFQGTVLDAVKAQFDVLKGSVSSEDRQRLEAHLAHVEQIQNRIESLPGGGGSSSCGAPRAPNVADVNGDGDPDPDHDETMRSVAELQLDLLVLALACDRTRIATYQYTNAWARMTYPWLGSPRTNHDLSHAGDSNQVAQEAWTSVATYHMELLARLIASLKAVPDGDGSLFDSTAIVWFSEVAVGNTHTHQNMPYVIAGDLGGTFRTGRYVDAGERFHNDLLVTLMNGMGVDGSAFGDPDLCTGPISELLA
jgi:hypothetical protein